MSSTENKDQQWDKFLSKIATEVDGLIIDTGYLKEFQRQIHPFAENWKNHNSDCKEYDRKRREHWEKVKANPKWQDKEVGPPEQGLEWDKDYLYGVGHDIGPLYEMPATYAQGLMAAIEKYTKRNEKETQQYDPTSAEHQRLQQTIADQRQNVLEIRSQFNKLNLEQRNKSWIKVPPDLDRRPPNRVYTHVKWWEYFDLIEEAVFGCWRPRLKEIRPDPRKTLIPEKGKQSLPQAASEQQEYERYYVVLTSIHDNMLTGVQSISKSIWPTELADSIWFRFTRGQPYGPNRPFIEAALVRVKVDLAEKPAETEQSKPLGKLARIRGWFKRHPHRYGLTVGVIFLILFFVLGLFKSQWRQWCWGVAGLAFLVLIVSLLGGRSR